MVLLDFGINRSRALIDGIISNALLAGACLLVINNMRYYLPKREKYWYVIVISVALSALWLLLMRVILWALFKNDTVYMQSLVQTSIVRYAIAFLMIGCCTVLSLLWYSQRDQQAASERKQDMERLAREAELNKLRQQLQPHFLFNSLNSISALTGSQPEKARHMIQQLSDFLRGTLKKKSSNGPVLKMNCNTCNCTSILKKCVLVTVFKPISIVAGRHCNCACPPCCCSHW
jgi:sensor histidine kinase YesM